MFALTSPKMLPTKNDSLFIVALFISAHLHKSLEKLGIFAGSQLQCDDFRQDFSLKLVIKVCGEQLIKERVSQILQDMKDNPQVMLVGELNVDVIPADAKFSLVRISSGRALPVSNGNSNGTQTSGMKREHEQEESDQPCKKIKMVLSELSDEEDLLMID
ncbi:hypothetical protein Ciccas_009724 [Cichlidogyrus casuarinus]|uniref:Uncharacterized protein n=1 Tax=Cichlidogyrus casuarinus TaxID=1844966 RepID=A0ABD2PX67_9PLAT